MSFILAVITAAVLLVADQVTKYLVVQHLAWGQSIEIIPGVLRFTHEKNYGGAWGVLQGYSWLLLAVTIVIIIVCFTMLLKKTFNSRLMYWAILLIISGGLGNAIDRVFRHGSVVDFLEVQFIRFPVFNIADCCVVVGASLVILYFIIDTIRDSRRKKLPEDA